jgi:Ca2+-transporting ATPase
MVEHRVPEGTTPWHARSAAEAAIELETDMRLGLTGAEAARRLAAEGANEIRRQERRSALAILANQFASLVIWVLIGAALLSLALGELVDGSAILAIIILNALIGFAQEYRSERAAAALARLSAPGARVARDGGAVVVPAREVVRGDILVLDAGDLIAADARLIEAASLRANEASLTGESEPVEKNPSVLPETTPLADRRNSVFLGTSIVHGSARALVTATGMRTEVGRIARLLETATSGDTPLQRRLDHVGRRLVWASLAIALLVFALGLARGIAPFELFLTAVSLAVAAIPEGLPAVVTLTLALGVERMARRNALVRRLVAVETLGSTQVICTDKTGTLTVGAMTLRKLVARGDVFSVVGDEHSALGATLFEGAGEPGNARAGIEELLWVAAACNDAELVARGAKSEIVGDPTEGALLVAAAKVGIRREGIERDSPRLATLPFDSERKRMTVVRRLGGAAIAAVKGAPEVVLERCTHVRTAKGTELLDEAGRAGIREWVRLLASDALRVLAFAERRLDRFPSAADVDRELTFLGLAGLQDPPRSDARDAVQRCKRAGIRTVMITGDHPDTARAIAVELGVSSAGDELMLGSEIDGLDDESLASRVERTSVYARVTAEHKLRIVRAWKSRGAIVAMTGDGVNDAPALREASIGVAMGRAGTDVAKEAADMVITDDRFSSIVAAVEEGRGIFDNIRKTLGYLLAGNAAELAVMVMATLIGTHLPLLPVQLLWINLVTDGLPALALATDPIDPDVLARPPRRPDSPFADRRLVVSILATAALTAAVTFGTFIYELRAGSSLAAARNAAFSVLVFAELMRAFGARSETRGIWELGLFSNLRLFAVVAASFALQLVIQRYSLAEELFQTQPISLAQCGAWVALGAVPLAALELSKLVGARQTKGKRRTSSGPR